MNLNHFNFDDFDHVTEMVKGVQRKGGKITFKSGEETTAAGLGVAQEDA